MRIDKKEDDASCSDSAVSDDGDENWETEEDENDSDSFGDSDNDLENEEVALSQKLDVKPPKLKPKQLVKPEVFTIVKDVTAVISIRQMRLGIFGIRKLSIQIASIVFESKSFD